MKKKVLKRCFLISAGIYIRSSGKVLLLFMTAKNDEFVYDTQSFSLETKTLFDLFLLFDVRFQAFFVGSLFFCWSTFRAVARKDIFVANHVSPGENHKFKLETFVPTMFCGGVDLFWSLKLSTICEKNSRFLTKKNSEAFRHHFKYDNFAVLIRMNEMPLSPT